MDLKGQIESRERDDKVKEAKMESVEIVRGRGDLHLTIGTADRSGGRVTWLDWERLMVTYF